MHPQIPQSHIVTRFAVAFFILVGALPGCDDSSSGGAKPAEAAEAAKAAKGHQWREKIGVALSILPNSRVVRASKQPLRNPAMP